uniref:Uncharacterized protein n=1 Tax=Anopheles atroparvus TaxID=41427 RepID=A0AAG5CMU4_ANOAO
MRRSCATACSSSSKQRIPTTATVALRKGLRAAASGGRGFAVDNLHVVWLFFTGLAGSGGGTSLPSLLAALPFEHFPDPKSSSSSSRPVDGCVRDQDTALSRASIAGWLPLRLTSESFRCCRFATLYTR